MVILVQWNLQIINEIQNLILDMLGNVECTVLNEFDLGETKMVGVKRGSTPTQKIIILLRKLLCKILFSVYIFYDYPWNIYTVINV